MRIARSYGHKVNVVLNDDNKLFGDVINFENPYESDSANYSLDLETEIDFYSFDDSEIKEIRIIF